MPILNWIGKEAVVNHDKEVPFRLLKKNKSKSVGDSENLIIEGDNLEALKALLPHYQNKIKCIYIDPPYNTGNEQWVYSDNVNSPKIKNWLGKVVGKQDEDLSRHDKWLCMMYPRLKLLSELLSNDGIIFVSIDDNELSNLKNLMDIIFFEENLLSILVWDLGTGTTAGHFTRSHEYVLAYARQKITLDNFSGGEGSIDDRAIKKISYKNPASEFTFKKGIKFESEEDIQFTGTWGGTESISLVSGNMKCKNGYLAEDVTLHAGWAMKDIMTSWFNHEETFDTKGQKIIEFYFNKNGILRYRKTRTIINPKTVLREVGSTKTGSQLLKKFFDNKAVFDYPKPTELIKRIIGLSTDENSLILDSFAGSGTTAQAVLELNKEDGGNRKFILIELEPEICKNITSQRVKKVIEGHGDISGIGGGFQYAVLDKKLFNSDGRLNETCTFEELASYIYFTETKTILDTKKISKTLLGNYNNAEYHLIFNGIGKNNLDRKFLTSLDRQQNKIIYADKCTLDDNILEKYNTVFKQIPYEVRVF